MSWTKYTIHTTAEAEDMVADLLAAQGITGIEIEDQLPVPPEENGGYFGDVVPDFDENDHTASISFYLENEDSDSSLTWYDPGTGPVKDRDGEKKSTSAQEEIVGRIREALRALAERCDIGEGTITVSRTEEEDWVNNWKQYFHQFTISGVHIVPSWEEPEQDPEADMLLFLDPGTAFGTGQHESTQLAARALRKYMKKGDRVLDIGTGSGILGMIALKDGASFVCGTDLDPNVAPALEENLEKNGIPRESFQYVEGDVAASRAVQKAVGGGYQVVTANIIAEILAGITPVVPSLLAPGGLFILSGILISRAEPLKQVLSECGFTIIEEMKDGEWESITAQGRV